MIRIVIADDHSLFRTGLRKLLDEERDLEVIGEAGSGADTLALCQDLTPDLLLLDLDMPGMDGFDVVKHLAESALGVKILILTMHANEEYALRLIRLGAAGFLIKCVSAAQMPEIIRQVHSGEIYIPEEFREKILSRMLSAKKSDPISRLTNRELQIVRRLAAGEEVKAIARDLDLSPRTVETHKSRAMLKLGLKNMVELVRFAANFGLADRL